jgi:dynein heavy chain
VLWKKDKKIEKLRRIYICFDAEDPRKYAARLERAFEERVYADSIIKYEFFIDNMPLTNADLPELDQEQKRRLENMAKTKRLKDMECTGLLMEVGYDYSRTMNKIIFNKFLEEGNEEIEGLRLKLPQKVESEVR